MNKKNRNFPIIQGGKATLSALKDTVADEFDVDIQIFSARMPSESFLLLQPLALDKPTSAYKLTEDERATATDLLEKILRRVAETKVLPSL